MISVVIPCDSGVGMLLEQLGALVDAPCPEPWEVIVVDNGFSKSEEVGDRLARFENSLPGFRVVTAFDRKGAGYARNVGVSAAKGDKLGFLDADDVAADGWLTAMSRALDEHTVVASRWDIEMLNDPDVRATRKNGQETGVRRYSHPNYLDHAGGCGLGVRREAFDRVGGFDEQFLLLEDTDLTWRLQLAGFVLAFASDAEVQHQFEVLVVLLPLATLARQRREHELAAPNNRLDAPPPCLVEARVLGSGWRQALDSHHRPADQPRREFAPDSFDLRQFWDS